MIGVHGQRLLPATGQLVKDIIKYFSSFFIERVAVIIEPRRHVHQVQTRHNFQAPIAHKLREHIKIGNGRRENNRRQKNLFAVLQRVLGYAVCADRGRQVRPIARNDGDLLLELVREQLLDLFLKAGDACHSARQDNGLRKDALIRLVVVLRQLREEVFHDGLDHVAHVLLDRLHDALLDLEAELALIVNVNGIVDRLIVDEVGELFLVFAGGVQVDVHDALGLVLDPQSYLPVHDVTADGAERHGVHGLAVPEHAHLKRGGAHVDAHEGLLDGLQAVKGRYGAAEGLGPRLSAGAADGHARNYFL